MPHIIRLREPWEFEPRQGSSGEGQYWRRFHRPTGLEQSKVWLVVQMVDSAAVVILNGRRIGEVPITEREARFEITAALEAVNLIEIELQADRGEQPKLGEVRLEIEEPQP